MAESDDVAVGALLAAGEGTRFGASSNKLLVDVEGEPIVRRAATTLTNTSVESALAVLGHEAEQVAEALDGLPLQTTVNPQYQQGQATSVVRAVSWADRQDANGLLIALGDMPWVQAETCERLLDGWRDGHEVVVPTYDGQRGNPVVFDERLFAELGTVAGDSGGRQLFANHDVQRIAVEDPGILRDIDRPGDLPD